MTNPLDPILEPGDTALLISVPHAGTALPPRFAERLTAEARALPDTDWYVDRLYGWARDMGVGFLRARGSRYLADLNRSADDVPLYAGPATRLLTGVVPQQGFDGRTLYLPGREPGGEENAGRIAGYWQPYHDLLEQALDRIVGRHGYAVLLDAHSIRAELPLLFDGVLPDLNLGSRGGRSAAPSLIAVAARALQHEAYTRVIDGRFQGGYITRHYGRPETGVHALQLEIAQRAYMRESPPSWDERRAVAMQSVLRRFVSVLLEWRPDDA